jgi:hypothetical protein
MKYTTRVIDYDNTIENKLKQIINLILNQYNIKGMQLKIFN